MTVCPNCDFENIEGEDVCEQCGQPLSDLHDPNTLVERSLLRDTIGILVSRPPIAVSPDTPVKDVLSLLVEKAIGCVIVVDDASAVIGVFSERDALQRLNTDAGKYLSHPISEFMTEKPQSLEADAKVAFAVHQMDIGGFRHIPIVDSQGKVSGIVSVRDILRYLTGRMTIGSSAS